MWHSPTRSIKTEQLIKQPLKRAMGLTSLQSTSSFLLNGDAQQHNSDHTDPSNRNYIFLVIFCILQLLVISVYCCITLLNQNAM